MEQGPSIRNWYYGLCSCPLYSDLDPLENLHRQRVQRLWFGLQYLGFRVEGFGLKVHGLGLREGKHSNSDGLQLRIAVSDGILGSPTLEARAL